MSLGRLKPWRFRLEAVETIGRSWTFRNCLQGHNGVHDSFQGKFAGWLVAVFACKIIKTDGRAEMKSHMIELKEIPDHPGKWMRPLEKGRHDHGIGQERQQSHPLMCSMDLAVGAYSALGKNSNASLV